MMRFERAEGSRGAVPRLQRQNATKLSSRPLVPRGGGGSLLGLLLWSRRSHTRLSLHLGFVNYGALFQLPAAQVALGHEVEVSGLALGAALARLNAAGIGLVRTVSGQVVLDVHGTLRTQLLHVNGLFLIGVTNDVQLAIGHLLQPQRQFVERVFAVVVHAPR